jgi:hypothetical protein
MKSERIIVKDKDSPEKAELMLIWYVSEPACVHFDFLHAGGQVVTWYLGREFVINALRGKGQTGDGDVRFFDDGGEQFTMTFYPHEDSRASIYIPRQPVVKFLKATLKALPLDEEDLTEGLDEFLSTLLG